MDNNINKHFMISWKALLLRLVEKSRATTSLYPVTADHCFARILFDNLVQDCWYSHLQRPASKKLTLQQQNDILSLGEDILTNPQICFTMQEKSLKWRNKL